MKAAAHLRALPESVRDHPDVKLLEMQADYQLGQKTQADTILKASPTHLLGLTLASTAAGMRKDFTKQADFDRRLIAAAKSERAKNLPEYQVTQVDLDSALARARRNVK